MAKEIPTLHPWPVRWWRTARFAWLRTRHKQVQARAAPFRMMFSGLTADCITRHIYRLGSHEPEITRYVIDNIRIGPNDVAIDVGANLGWYSVLLDRVSAAGARIFAFEPDPATYQLLLKNLLANRATRVTPVNLALGEEPSVKSLYRYKESNNGRHTLVESGRSADTVPVRVATLQEFWKSAELGNRRIRFLKIDVEGYEYFVLRGAGELLQHCDSILLEYAPGALREAGVEPGDLFGPLERAGFRARVFENGEPTSISFAQLASREIVSDILLLRS